MWSVPNILLQTRVGQVFAIDYYSQYVIADPCVKDTKYSLSAVFKLQVCVLACSLVHPMNWCNPAHLVTEAHYKQSKESECRACMCLFCVLVVEEVGPMTCLAHSCSTQHTV